MNPAFLRKLRIEREKVESWDVYPFNLPVIKQLDEIEFDPKVTFIVGENGAGKSTLIEAIALACGLQADGGNKNMGGGSVPTHSNLHQFIRLVKGWSYPKNFYYLRAESFYNVAANVDELGVAVSYGGKGLHEQSHGESFMSTMLHKFKAGGFFILDEPEAALSPARQLAALRRIHDLAEQKSQFVIATHSPILMAYPGALILQCSSEGVTPIQYEETEHYIITRQFLNNPQGMLDELLSDEDSSKRQWRSLED